MLEFRMTDKKSKLLFCRSFVVVFFVITNVEIPINKIRKNKYLSLIFFEQTSPMISDDPIELSIQNLTKKFTSFQRGK